MLFMMIMLWSTLSGWTQFSPNWTIIENKINQDTIIQYSFHKSDLTNLRLYINLLEEYKETAEVSEIIINTQEEELKKFKELIVNKDVIIGTQKNIIVEYKDINRTISDRLSKSQKRAKAWPYWLGGGFIGGILLCLLVK